MAISIFTKVARAKQGIHLDKSCSTKIPRLYSLFRLPHVYVILCIILKIDPPYYHSNVAATA